MRESDNHVERVKKKLIRVMFISHMHWEATCELRKTLFSLSAV